MRRSHLLGLLAFVLALPGAAGAIPFQVSAEMGSNTPVSAPATGTQTAPAVASDGTNAFVVWADGRDFDLSTYIAGARVAPDGGVLDPSSLPISSGATADAQPAVAFDGTNYLVVWARYAAATGEDIWGARIAADGTVLDPDGFAIGVAAGDQLHPTVAFDGTHYLVAWQDNRSGGSYDIVGARVGTDGSVLEPNGIAICTAINDQLNPSAASDGAQFVVAWTDVRAATSPIYAARISDSGTVIDVQGVPVSVTANAGSPSLVWTHGQYFGAWIAYGSFPNLAGNFISSTLQPVMPADVVLDRSVQCALPSAATDGNQFVVAYLDETNNQVDLARVDPDGGDPDPLGGPGNFIGFPASDLTSPAATFAGGAFVLTWSTNYDGRGGLLASQDVAAMQIVPGRVYGPSYDVSLGSDPQMNAAATPLASSYLLAWADRRHADAGLELDSVQVTLAAGVLDPAGATLAESAADANDPALVTTASGALLAWSGAQGLLGQALDGTGTPVGSPVVVSGANATISRVALAYDGSATLVVWDDQRTSSDQVYAARVDDLGTVLDPFGILISSNNDADGNVSVAFGGDRFLVVWEENAFRSETIHGRFLALDGGALTDDLVLVSDSAYASAPSVASDGQGFLLTWLEYTGLATSQVQAAPDGGASVTPTVYLVTPLNVSQPAPVAFDGRLYQVAWTAPGATSSLHEVRVARLLPDGTLLDPAGYALFPADAEVSSLASRGDLQTLVAYQRFDLAPPYGSQRVRSVILSPLGQGAPCGADPDCASDHCADGVCCDTACGGSNPSDCQACSVAAGAAADGTCGPLQSTAVCQAATECALAATCDGVDLTCPPPTAAPDGTLCSAGRCQAGTCVPAGTSGSSSSALSASSVAASTSGSSASSSATSTASATSTSAGTSSSATSTGAASTSSTQSSSGTSGGSTFTSSVTTSTGSSGVTTGTTSSGTTAGTTASSGAGSTGSHGTASSTGTVRPTGPTSASSSTGGSSSAGAPKKGCGCDSSDSGLLLPGLALLALVRRRTPLRCVQEG